MMYMAEQRQTPIDIKKRLEGVRKTSEGAQGFDIVPVLVIGGALMVIAIAAFFFQKGRRRAALEEDRRARRAEEELRQKRLAEEAARQQQYTLGEADEVPCGVPCPITDLLRVRGGAPASLLSHEPGFIPSPVKVVEAIDGGVVLEPRGSALYAPDEGDQWLSIRQAGAPRLYPVSVRRHPTQARQDTLLASPRGSGCKFERFGSIPCAYSATVTPAANPGAPVDAQATPVRVVAIGIGTLRFTGPIEVQGGMRLTIRVALPGEFDSSEFEARVRNQTPDDVGDVVVEAAFDATPSPVLDTLARTLVRELDLPLVEQGTVHSDRLS